MRPHTVHFFLLLFCRAIIVFPLIALQGDSGGPLWTTDPATGIATVVGVVSRGAGCGGKDLPGIVTRIKAEADWIRSMLGAHSPGTAPEAEEEKDEEEEEGNKKDGGFMSSLPSSPPQPPSKPKVVVLDEPLNISTAEGNKGAPGSEGQEDILVGGSQFSDSRVQLKDE